MQHITTYKCKKSWKDSNQFLCHFPPRSSHRNDYALVTKKSYATCHQTPHYYMGSAPLKQAQLLSDPVQT
jgi:hypothetical protein